MSSMTADQAERLALEIRGIADSILAAREMIHISDRDIENSISIVRNLIGNQTSPARTEAGFLHACRPSDQDQDNRRPDPD